MPKFKVYEIPARDYLVADPGQLLLAISDFRHDFDVADAGEIFNIFSLKPYLFEVFSAGRVYKLYQIKPYSFEVFEFKYSSKKEIHSHYYANLSFWVINFSTAFDGLGVTYPHFYIIKEIRPRDFYVREIA